MKYLLGIILFSSVVHASDSVELMGSGVSWHISDTGSSQQYDHKLTDNGKLLYTSQIGLKKIHVDPNDGYMSLTLLRSSNEIGNPIFVAYGGTGVRLMSMLYLGLGYGGYIQNNEDFKYKGIAPYSATGNTNAFVPLIGFEVNSHFDIDNSWFIGFNNLLTSSLTTHNLSLGYRY